MIRRSDIVGVILAGGLSRRMFEGASGQSGVRDKGLLPLGRVSMIETVLARLGPQVATTIINANGDPARFAPLALPVVPDPIDGFVGPLAGVLAGMQWATANKPAATHILTVSSDAPFLPTDLGEKLATAVADQPTAIAIAQSNDEVHPVIGLWPIAHRQDLAAELASGVRKVLRWTDKHGTVPVPFPMIAVGSETIDPFFNANTPQELDEARRLLALVS
ncbi:MAG: Molybdenum cofactor guanylyltransferase [Pseudomonadota bacterium]|jgi:molybdopterin-guanine dinucleotide biosynthesis protein A